MKICSFRVLVKPDPLEKEIGKDVKFVVARTSLDERRERAAQTTGTVVQVGPTAWRQYDDGEPWAEVGDRILYTRFGGKNITNPEDPENDLMIIDDENVLAVLEADEEYRA